MGCGENATEGERSVVTESPLFAPSVDQLADVRRQVRSALLVCGLTPDSGPAAAVLVVAGELAANAVAHARTPFTVALEFRRGVIRVEVSDGVWTRPGPELICGTTPRRGLQRVRALSDRWGIDRLVDGKAVWAEIAY